ncbi:hypothetical protein LJC18_00960 [Lachnospiraceae bacterium OttesenSCG-928-E19]|nr:hypothetical protein [Lachnospiraceae bacterium OttesenSCG-928-E19]
MQSSISNLNLKPDTYYYLSPYGLGDTMMICGFLDAIKQKNQSENIHFFIKPNHEIIMKMYGIKDYTVFSFDFFDNREYLKELSERNPYPKPGEVFIAHPKFGPFENLLKEFNEFKMDFRHLYINFFGLDESVDFKHPIWYPSISDEVQQKLSELAPLEKIILVAPEARSCGKLIANYWNKIVQNQHKKGFVCIENAIGTPSTNAPHFELSLSDCIAIAINCAGVYSLRSGLCDLISCIGDKLTVIYPDKKTYLLYSLNKNFNTETIQEKIIDRKKLRWNFILRIFY